MPEATPYPNQPTSATEQVQKERTRQHEFRKLPAVDALLREPTIGLLVAEHGVTAITNAVRSLLDAQRTAISRGQAAPALDAWPTLVNGFMAEQNLPSLRPVINATGVIIHTNLGRAPLSDAARKAVHAITEPYSNLEYDLAVGARGSRYDHARNLLCELTGAEDAIVVNNCASALYLVLSVFCRNLEVIISRSQLVEIGGGFRIPDVLRQSGAKLVEVGTSNRTYARDFADAVTTETAALLRVHSSNFRQIGFVATPELDEMVNVARRAAAQKSREAHAVALPIVIDDLGSGALLDTAAFGLMAEPTAQESMAAGADIATFSGDKLLGGPQAGIIVGRAELIARVRRHPMMRALRVDKMTLAALEATLRSYQRGRALQEIPIWQMISATADAMRERALVWQTALHAHGIQTQVRHAQSAIGGGSLPGETLPTHVLALSGVQNELSASLATKWANALRQQPTPVVCRIQDEQLLFDPRTVLPAQEEALLQSIRNVYADLS
ncbi:MAG: L-seryl-tRNA(Sec) selenium transferase [Caldilineaceae bacterium]|nr:L-seryl-tRNA(Sec) selenium transferase [Caldilineaceae bacterium]MCB0095928.1 L-seryl-tRNA(Sec) selenium transferase [Caldilineaceae bacterium]MCB0143292.1 L-seryl-tRNA(Sec) selenium transferase [Caldilineaceae bacterium]